MENNALTHHGVKGMKWGVRRYRNKDGSLTPAGQKRYDRDVRDLSNKKKKDYKANPDKWVNEDLSRTRKLTDETSQLAGKLRTANSNAVRNKPRTKMDLSNMSDKEMRDQINRALLERQYNDLFNPQTVSRGRERADRILETAGTVLGIAGTSLGIALSIREIMNKG